MFHSFYLRVCNSDQKMTSFRITSIHINNILKIETLSSQTITAPQLYLLFYFSIIKFPNFSQNFCPQQNSLTFPRLEFLTLFFPDFPANPAEVFSILIRCAQLNCPYCVYGDTDTRTYK